LLRSDLRTVGINCAVNDCNAIVKSSRRRLERKSRIAPWVGSCGATRTIELRQTIESAGNSLLCPILLQCAIIVIYPAVFLHHENNVINRLQACSESRRHRSAVVGIHVTGAGSRASAAPAGESESGI